MRNPMPILVALLTLCLAFTGTARAAFTFGARVGESIAKASLDVQQNFDRANRTGFTATAFLDTGLGLFDLQPEVSYVQKGVKDAITGEEIKLDYVELAALIKTGPPLSLIQPHLFTGLAADYSTRKHVGFGNFDFSTKGADWTVPIGADLRIALGKYAIYGDARYDIGLTDVAQGSANVKNLKNRAWVLSAGIGKSF